MHTTKSVLSKNKNKQTSISCRSILASPYEKFWPVIGTNDSDALTNLLLKLLPSAATPKGSLTRKKLRKIFKEKNKNKRKAMWKCKENVLSKEEVEKARLSRKSLLMGVNSVTRGIEKSQVTACLISEDASPQLLVSHIVASAARAGVPVLVVPSLKKTTRTALGVPCLSLALHKSVGENKDNLFYELYEEIVKLSSSFVVPDHLIVTKRHHPLNKAENDVYRNNDSLPGFATTEAIKSTPTTENKYLSNTFKYLHRSSVTQRVFVPPKPDVKLDSGFTEFIPISKEENSSLKRHHERESESETDISDGLGPTNLDKLFFMDTSAQDSVRRVDSSTKQNQVNDSRLNFKPTIIKKVRSNPNKKKRKR